MQGPLTQVTCAFAHIYQDNKASGLPRIRSVPRQPFDTSGIHHYCYTSMTRSYQNGIQINLQPIALEVIRHTLDPRVYLLDYDSA
jgi:hypothetical protein